MADFALSGELTLNSREFVSAADRAAKAADQVQDRLDQLDGATATSKANLDDQASPQFADLNKRLANFDAETATAKVNATDKASPTIEAVRAQVKRLDGEEAVARLELAHQQAEQDLRRFRKELSSADGNVAEAKILANIADAKAKIKAIDGDLAQLDATVAEPRIEMPDAGGMGLNAGATFGASAIGAIGAAGIGTAIVTAFDNGMSRLNLAADFRDRFGLVEADAAAYGKIAGDVYASGWGESLEQVTMALGQVQQQLVTTGAIGGDEMESLTTRALAVSKVFQDDVGEIIGTVGYMLRNNLAPDASYAMDVLVDGLQNGANYADDLYDTFTEYSAIFDAFGLDADDVMRVFTAGMQNGVRDTDKLADAILELRNRTLDNTDDINAAYADIGLSASATRSAIAEGGETARAAFVSVLEGISNVEDGAERHRIGMALLGTLYEDVGPVAVDVLLAVRDATQDVAGTTDDLVASQDKVTSQAEVLKRRLMGVVGTGFEWWAEQANDQLDRMAGLFGPIITAAGWLADGLQRPFDYFEKDLNGAVADFGATSETSAFQAGLLADAATGAAEEVGRAGTAARDAYDPTDNLAAAAGRLQGQYEAAKDALIAYADEQRAAVDPAFKAIKAQRDYEIALWKVNEAGGATAENIMALVEADLELDQANADLATSSDVTTASLYDTAIQAGATEEQALALARQFDDTRGRAEDYADGVYDPPVDADTATADWKIAGTTKRAREYADAGYNPQFGAKTSEADRKIDVTYGKANQLQRTFTAHLSVSGAWAAQMAIGGVLGALNQVDGRTATATLNRVTRNIYVDGARADGGPVRGGGTYLVGEEGPELVTFPHNGYVHDADTTASIMSNTTNVMNRSTITNQAPAVGRGGDFIVQNYGDNVTAEDVAIWNQRKAISA